MNKITKQLFFLVCVILIAGFFRFYQLGNVPPSPDWDEAALGYNAYSIFKTGKDEYGTFLPLSIRSFDDYKPPLYVYLTVPSVALFGLTPWSTRLPSAVMGVLAVLGTFFLVKELFSKTKNYEPGTKNLPTIASLLLALSPWHIQFSRIAFEANIGITVNIWAVTLFLAGLRKKIYLPFSAALFGIGMYAYHSERIFLPLLFCLLLSVYWSKLFRKENSKVIAASFVVGLFIVLPLVPVLFNKSAMLRLRGTSSFTDQTNLLSRVIDKIEIDRKLGDTFGELLDNRRIVWVKTIVSGYLSHFSLRWLFLTGDNPRHHAPDMGLLYLWELPFLLYGLFNLLKTRKSEPETKLLMGWLLIAPIAAAPTTGLPHAIRTLVFLPVFQIFTAYGILSVIVFIKELRTRNKELLHKCLLLIVFCLAALNIAYYLIMYFSVMNREYSEHWQYGMKEAVEYTESVKDKYQKIVVSTRLEQSYMFYLFYLKYDPKKYLAQGGTKSGSFEEEHNGFDKYEFRLLFWNSEVFDGKTLYVGSSIEIPHGNNAHITFLDGTSAIEIKDRKD